MGQRGNGTGGWWVWVITGVVITIGAVALLEHWFRVSSSAAIGWGTFAAASFHSRRRVDVRSPALWGMSAVMVFLLIGLTLLLGAAGLSNDDRTDSVVPGAVLGGALFAAGALGLLVLRVLQRRKAVTDEVERHRAEHAAPTTTGASTTGAAADDLS
jgi:hypothetical protein